MVDDVNEVRNQRRFARSCRRDRAGIDSTDGHRVVGLATFAVQRSIAIQDEVIAQLECAPRLSSSTIR